MEEFQIRVSTTHTLRCCLWEFLDRARTVDGGRRRATAAAGRVGAGRRRWALGAGRRRCGSQPRRVGDSGSSPERGRLSGVWTDEDTKWMSGWLLGWAGLRPRPSKKYSLQKFPTPRAVARVARVPAPPLNIPTTKTNKISSRRMPIY
jgi:hypothetical protein